MKDPNIKSKVLDISLEDILNEYDQQVLVNYNIRLKSYLAQLLRDNEVSYYKELPKNDYKDYLIHDSLRRSVSSRLGYFKEIIKESGELFWTESNKRRNKKLYIKFMEVAKRELDENMFKNILSKARDEIIKYEEGNNSQ